jgi:hypothetical protein
MNVEPVEIYSDATNAAVMRHPGRRFPGVLVQGDTLHSMCRNADEVCAKARSALDGDTYIELNELRNHLQAFLTHYKSVLADHGIELPFNDL